MENALGLQGFIEEEQPPENLRDVCLGSLSSEDQRLFLLIEDFCLRQGFRFAFYRQGFLQSDHCQGEIKESLIGDESLRAETQKICEKLIYIFKKPFLDDGFSFNHATRREFEKLIEKELGGDAYVFLSNSPFSYNCNFTGFKSWLNLLLTEDMASAELKAKIRDIISRFPPEFTERNYHSLSLEEKYKSVEKMFFLIKEFLEFISGVTFSQSSRYQLRLVYSAPKG